VVDCGILEQVRVSRVVLHRIKDSLWETGVFVAPKGGFEELKKIIKTGKDKLKV
jgi:hypothetical protein